MKIFNRLVILLVLMNFSLLYSQDATAAKEEEVTIKGELIADDEAGLSDEEKARKKDIIKQEAMWKNPDYVGYNKAFEDLHKLSKAFANNKYRLALSAYQSGMNSILKMRENIEQYRKEQAEKKRLDEKWYWQKNRSSCKRRKIYPERKNGC